jgi:4-coumarate--CoA ligase
MTNRIISFLSPAPIDPNSAGTIVPNTECKIVDPSTGKFLPPKVRGELWSRSPSNSLGYLRNPTATAETFDSDGFVHTGDEAYIDEQGRVYVVDRIKELIKCRGFQVAPAELEGLILDLPFVADVGVIGIEHEFDGEVPRAFVVLQEKFKMFNEKEKSKLEETIKQHVKDHKVRYKWLEKVEFVEEIPKNPSGKLLRRQLRNKAREDESRKKAARIQAKL